MQCLKFYPICPGTEIRRAVVVFQFSSKKPSSLFWNTLQYVSTSPQQSRLFLHLVQHLVLVHSLEFEIRISKDLVEEGVARTGKENPQKKVNKNIEYLKSD